jgi:hypothetical protein
MQAPSVDNERRFEHCDEDSFANSQNLCDLRVGLNVSGLEMQLRDSIDGVGDFVASSRS